MKLKLLDSNYLLENIENCDMRKNNSEIENNLAKIEKTII